MELVIVALFIVIVALIALAVDQFVQLKIQEERYASDRRVMDLTLDMAEESERILREALDKARNRPIIGSILNDGPATYSLTEEELNGWPDWPEDDVHDPRNCAYCNAEFRPTEEPTEEVPSDAN